MACTPLKRIRRHAVVPSPWRSTSIVSPSFTDTTLAVQTSQSGPGSPATHAPRRASAAAGRSARSARSSSRMGSARRTRRENPSPTSEVSAPSTAGAAPQGALHLADRLDDAPRRAPAEVALPARGALGDAAVVPHGEHEVLGPARPPHAPLRTEAGHDDHDVDLPHPPRERAPTRGGRSVPLSGGRAHRAPPVAPPDPLRPRLRGDPVLLLGAPALEQQLERRALGQRLGRVEPLIPPDDPLAVAREPQAGQLGVQLD